MKWKNNLIDSRASKLKTERKIWDKVIYLAMTVAYRCRWKENATISVVGKIMAEASAAASQIAGGERRAVSAAHVTPQRLRNIYVHSKASLRPSTHYRRRDGLFGGWGDASEGKRRSRDGCAGSGALTRRKMAKKAIRGANQIEKKKKMNWWKCLRD